jgi:membrane glycosyltransferase
VLTAGLNFWQLGESYYWGHNAILRVDPFMRHCALGRLPGRGVLSGEILSHDFVEAALMRRAGWAVWIAHDLPGSYEEIPPNLIQESSRDRRWCLGNLINSRLFWAEGLHPAHRAVFMAGVMTYLSAPLWLVSLALSTALIVVQTVVGPRYFVQPAQLFPDWPEWHVEWAIGLAVATASVLFVPRFLAAALVLRRGAREYGGPVRLVLSLLFELVFSALLAPIRMLFHTEFVLAALTRWGTSWRSPAREDAETSWREALRRHGGHTALGIAWAAAVYGLAPGFVWWLLPTVGALVLSIPISVHSSRVSLGRRFRGAGLLLIPEETRPPLELRIVRRCVRAAATRAGFADAVLDPLVNAIACATARPRTLAPAVRAARARLVATAVREGPAGLTRPDRMALLSDPAALARLHLEAWASAAARARWRSGAPLATP